MAKLDHPIHKKFQFFLERRGAPAHITAAGGDLYCEVCYDNQQGNKLGNPALIHTPKDFDDNMGMGPISVHEGFLSALYETYEGLVGTVSRLYHGFTKGFLKQFKALLCFYKVLLELN